jgi:hypothetical protein
MSQNPYSHLSEEQQRALFKKCSDGEQFIFTGEEITVPGSLARAYKGMTGRLFEVTPSELLDVAKRLDRPGDKPGKTIERAYSLICEAHVFSRNLKHWNDKSKRDHASQSIHDLTEDHVLDEGAFKGKVPRIPLLQAFLKERKLPSNKTDAGKIFNRWVKETLREKDFTDTIPWNPFRADYEQNLYETLHQNGWIRWVSIEGGTFLVSPEKTDKPSHRSRTKPKEGDHETRPWWPTKTTWWPNPTATKQKDFKAKYLCDNFRNFHSAHHAKKCLTSFENWLKLQERIEEKFGPGKKVQKNDPETGRFR